MATVIIKEEFDADQPRVIDRAWAGEEIVVKRSGAGKLRLVPVDAPVVAAGRRPGILKGLVSLPPNFPAPLPPGWDGWPGDTRLRLLLDGVRCLW